MKTKQLSRSTWYNKISGAALLVVISLTLVAAIGARAIDTGSLQQYAISIILIGFATNRINRIVSVARPSKGKKT